MWGMSCGERIHEQSHTSLGFRERLMLKTGFESELRTGKVTECVTLMDRDYKVRKEDGGPLGNTTEGKGLER